jgi:predicted DNA-binding protein with PD1-like motif
MFLRKGLNSHVVVLRKDELIVNALTELCTIHQIRGGHITGIGAVKDVQLGYYDLHKKDYIRKTFSNEDYELIALNGNISLKDDVPYIHVHTALGKSDFSVFGGHMFEATVAVTAEIYITTIETRPVRRYSEELGLSVIDYCRME